MKMNCDGIKFLVFKIAQLMTVNQAVSTLSKLGENINQDN